MAITLLTSDIIDLALSIARGPEWGIYQDGKPVIQPVPAVLSQQFDPILSPIRAIATALGKPNLIPVTASTASFDFRQDWRIANYPQERGAFQSYDKVTLPYDVKVTLVCAGPTPKRQAFISTILAIGESTALFDIVTPEFIFTDCNIGHISWPRRSDHGVSMIVAEVWFQKIRENGISSFGITRDAFNSRAISLGTVQGIVPAGTTTKVLSLFGVR
jgi:hypothetical protein